MPKLRPPPTEYVTALAPPVLKGSQRMAPRTGLSPPGVQPFPPKDPTARTRYTPRQFHESVRRDILYRYLEMQTKEEIADIYWTTTRTINVILDDPEIREERKRVMALVTTNVAERLNLLGGEAVDIHRDTMRGKLESKLKLDAAKSVLETAKIFQKKNDEGGPTDLGAQVLREIGKGIAMKLAVPQPLLEAEEVAEPVDG